MTEILDSTGLTPPTICPITEAVETLAHTEGTGELGAVYTRREVVDFILDLSGYTSDNRLHRKRVLEPSFGNGDFLLPLVERLIVSWKKDKRKKRDTVVDLRDCVRAVELHYKTFIATRVKLIECLERHGIRPTDAEMLGSCWLIRGDFLLTPLPGDFDFVVGNPPYVRQELIPDRLLSEYRDRYKTIYDRADLYIPFIERSLHLLAAGGRLGFICADRWMKNRYGGPLRRMISEGFRLNIYVDMTDTPAFHSEVIAYPAITIISRNHQASTTTRIARRPEVSKNSLSKLSKALLGKDALQGTSVTELTAVTANAEPWLLDDDERLSLVRFIEAKFPAIEETGCKIGIGVATGADSAFIGPLAELDVEDDRKLPLVMTRDILSGKIVWRGLGVINPFENEGGLVRLDSYPRLKNYLERHKAQINRRHVAQKNPSNWYRTIDRIFPALTTKPKLLIPDIKGQAHIVFDPGSFYPHHNLYYITSESWELEALQAVLMSGIARLFVETYSIKMRGGYLRFQAQYLRRIRIPHWDQVSLPLRRSLKSAARASDVIECNAAVADLYGFSKDQRKILLGNR